MKKKLLLFALSAMMVGSMSIPAFAAEGSASGASGDMSKSGVYAQADLSTSWFSGAVKMTVDGTAVEFKADLGKPYIDENSRTMVPLRATADALGAKVEWNQEKQTATFYREFAEKDEMYTGKTDADGNKEYTSKIQLDFKVGSDSYTWTGWSAYTGYTAEQNAALQTEEMTLPMTTYTVNTDGRTYAPARYLAEGFGYKVDWEQDSHTVVITDQSKIKGGAMTLDQLKEHGAELKMLGIWQDSSLGYEQLQFATLLSDNSDVASLTLAGAEFNGAALVTDELDDGILAQANYDFDINAKSGISARFDQSKLVINSDAEGKLVSGADDSDNAFFFTYEVTLKDGTVYYVDDAFVLCYDGIARCVQRI